MKALIKNPFFWITVALAAVIIVVAVRRHRKTEKEEVGDVANTTTTKVIDLTPAQDAQMAAAGK